MTKFTYKECDVTACQFCRVHKTECDNVCLIGSFCVQHKFKCISPDSEMNAVGKTAECQTVDRVETEESF